MINNNNLKEQIHKYSASGVFRLAALQFWQKLAKT